MKKVALFGLAGMTAVQGVPMSIHAEVLTPLVEPATETKNVVTMGDFKVTTEPIVITGVDGKRYLKVDENGFVTMNYTVKNTSTENKTVDLAYYGGTEPSTDGYSLAFLSEIQAGEVKSGSFRTQFANLKTDKLLRLISVDTDYYADFAEMYPDYDFTSEPGICEMTAAISVIDQENVNGSDWVKGSPKLHILAHSDAGIEKVVYNFNGVSNEITAIELADYVDDIPIEAEGEVTYSVSVYDKIGNVKSSSGTIKLDRVAPTVKEFTSSVSANDIHVDGTTGYVKGNGPISYSITFEDDGSGIKDVTLDGVAQTIGSDGVISGLLDNGSHRFLVTDRLGNQKEYSLGDLFGKEFTDLLITDAIPSLQIDDFTEDATEINGTKWYQQVASFHFSLSGEYLNRIVVSIDGNEVLNEAAEEKDYSIPLSSLEDGKHTITVTASAKNGESVSEEITFGVDQTAPVLKDLESSERGVLFPGVFSISKSTIYPACPVFNFVADKDTVGIDEFILRNKNTGTELKNKDGKFSITEEGNYTIEVVDKLGNTTGEISLANQFSIFNILIDSEKPTLQIDVPSTNVLAKDGTPAYGDDIDFELNGSDKMMKDLNLMLNSTSLLSREDVFNVGFNSATQTNDGVATLYHIVSEAHDYFDRYTKVEKSFYVDKEAPVITEESISQASMDSTYGVFFVTKPVVNVSAEDAVVAIGEYILYDGDGNELERNTTGKFTLDSGEYSIAVSDVLGNTSEKVTLKQLLGLKSNKIIIDSVKPEIDCSRPEGDVNGWFADDVVYEATVSDTIGIYSAEIRINGTVVDSFHADRDGVTNQILRASTESCTANSDKSYSILVKVVDHAGNIETYSDTIKIDRDVPSNVQGMVEAAKEEKSYGVYFKNEPTIKVSAEDNDSGIKEYILVAKDGSEVKNKDGIFTLGNGEYSVKVVDKVGNVSQAITLKDLLDLSSNKIVIDGVKPEIDCSRPEGDVNGWFADDVVYEATVSDTIGIYSAEVSINGTVVDSFEANQGGVLDTSLKADTSKVKANRNGSYEVIVKVVDNAGNMNEWSDIIYLDETAPEIERFVITAEGYKEGAVTKGNDKYGFYLKGASDVEVHVMDGDVSSGMSKIHYVLKDGKGNTIKEDTASIVGGVAVISLPKNFKGFLSAYAVDKVGNVGSENKPDGIVSEDSNMHINTSKIEINLPKYDAVDHQGLPLYNGNVKSNAVIQDTTSGVRMVEWGIDGDTMGVANVDNDGQISGDTASVVSKDKNLVVNLEKALAVNKNANGVRVWIKVTDRSGHVSTNERLISIDKDNPVIAVKYDETLDSGYYDGNRVAKLSITERNFNANEVKIAGNYTSIGNWVYLGNDVWQTTVSFAEDGVYQWGVEYTDMAGNKAKGYQSEKFTIDKTSPVLEVSFDNNSAENGNYYKEGRTASIRVVEKNFDTGLVTLVGDGKIAGWTHKGDVHTAHIAFPSDGEYEFSLIVADKAGNSSKKFDSGMFVIDKTAPEIAISGVADGSANAGKVAPVISCSDTNYDGKRVEINWTKDGKTLTFDGSRTTSEKGEVFSFKDLDVKVLNDGIYTIRVSVIDKAGNSTEKTLTYSVNRFGSTYYSELLDSVNGKYFNKEFDVTLSEINVNRIVSRRVQLVKNGSTVDLVEGKDYSVTENGANGWYRYDYKIAKSLFEKDAKYEIKVTSTDAAGNISQSQDEYRNFNISFFIDKTKPIVQVLDLEERGIYNDTAKKVSVSIKDNLALEKVKIMLNGKEVEYENEGDTFTFVIPESNSLQDVEIVVTDKAGNENVVAMHSVMVSSNAFYRWVANKPVFYSTLAGVAAVFAGLFFVLEKKKTSKKK